jgi:hypothetical protein
MVAFGKHRLHQLRLHVHHFLGLQGQQAIDIIPLLWFRRGELTGSILSF